jgi:hypothetical protein
LKLSNRHSCSVTPFRNSGTSTAAGLVVFSDFSIKNPAPVSNSLAVHVDFAPGVEASVLFWPEKDGRPAQVGRLGHGTSAWFGGRAADSGGDYHALSHMDAAAPGEPGSPWENGSVEASTLASAANCSREKSSTDLARRHGEIVLAHRQACGVAVDRRGRGEDEMAYSLLDRGLGSRRESSRCCCGSSRADRGPNPARR